MIKKICILVLIFYGCKNFRNEENLPKTKYFIPEINKMIEFNSLMNIKGTIQEKHFEYSVCSAQFDLIDSVRNLIGKVSIGRNSFVDSVGYITYNASRLYYQKLLQDNIYRYLLNEQVKDHSSPFIYSFSYLNSNKGKILMSKISAKPNAVSDNSPVTTNVDTFDFYVYNTNTSIILYRFAFDLDSLVVDFRFYTTDTSTVKVKKLLEPVVNTMTIK